MLNENVNHRRTLTAVPYNHFFHFSYMSVRFLNISCGMFHAVEAELNVNMWIGNNNSNQTLRKRLRESVPDQLGNFVSFEGINANTLLNMPQSNAEAVSTGLRLCLEGNDTLNSTNDR